MCPPRRFGNDLRLPAGGHGAPEPVAITAPFQLLKPGCCQRIGKAQHRCRKAPELPVSAGIRNEYRKAPDRPHTALHQWIRTGEDQFSCRDGTRTAFITLRVIQQIMADRCHVFAPGIDIQHNPTRRNGQSRHAFMQQQQLFRKVRKVMKIEQVMPDKRPESER